MRKSDSNSDLTEKARNVIDVVLLDFVTIAWKRINLLGHAIQRMNHTENQCPRLTGCHPFAA